MIKSQIQKHNMQMGFKEKINNVLLRVLKDNEVFAEIYGGARFQSQVVSRSNDIIKFFA